MILTEGKTKKKRIFVKKCIFILQLKNNTLHLQHQNKDNEYVESYILVVAELRTKCCETPACPYH